MAEANCIDKKLLTKLPALLASLAVGVSHRLLMRKAKALTRSFGCSCFVLSNIAQHSYCN